MSSADINLDKEICKMWERKVEGWQWRRESMTRFSRLEA
jgi:hypothetical protein